MEAVSGMNRSGNSSPMDTRCILSMFDGCGVYLGWLKYPRSCLSALHSAIEIDTKFKKIRYYKYIDLITSFMIINYRDH